MINATVREAEQPEMLGVIMSELGALFQKRLKEERMSLRELARRSKVPPATVSDVLTGKSENPDLQTVVPLARALDIPIAAVLIALGYELGPVDMAMNTDSELGIIQRLMAMSSPSQRARMVKIAQAALDELPG